MSLLIESQNVISEDFLLLCYPARSESVMTENFNLLGHFRSLKFVFNLSFILLSRNGI